MTITLGSEWADNGQEGMVVTLACPRCGDQVFRAWQGGSYTEREYLWLDRPTASRADLRTWEDKDESVETSDPWECRGGHVAPPHLQNALEQWRDEH